DVLTYLNGISTLSGNVRVVGPPSGPFTIIFGGTLANQIIAPLIPTVSLPTARNEVQQLNFSTLPTQTITGGQFRLTFDGVTFPSAAAAQFINYPTTNPFDPNELAGNIQGAL